MLQQEASEEPMVIQKMERRSRPCYHAVTTGSGFRLCGE